MKILNLKILNPLDEVIRNIDFEENGISFIYGDIQEPTNKKATINSLGKTLLLKFLDYILGAKEDVKSISDRRSSHFFAGDISDWLVFRTTGVVVE